MSDQFTWISFYKELAEELIEWQSRQDELTGFLEELRARDFIVTPLMDKDGEGAVFLLEEIDPFTFFGVFNRQIKEENRIAILLEMKRFFNLESELPSDFFGIPVLSNMSSWFISYQGKRKPDDVSRLWKVFVLALQEKEPLQSEVFRHAFDQALAVRQTNVNLTMGLYWIRSGIFLNIDQINRSYLGIKLPSKGISAKFYIDTIETIRKEDKSFPEISYAAWLAGTEKTKSATETPNQTKDKVNYWLVGAYWDSREPADQTQRFLDEGIWENGYEDRLLDEVNSMSVGDQIAIKAASTQRKDLPFDNRNKTASRMVIKAIGTIVANRNDGRTVEVEWTPDFEEKSWYFYTNRGTIWHIRLDDEYKWKEAADQLKDFVWGGQPQDYDWFCQRWLESDIPPDSDEDNKPPYGIDDILASGVFLNEQELTEILNRLDEKKAMIIQGPPGVGKTFIARKLAYALMKEIDPKRLAMVQFHQSYSYDDFVRGYRPLPGQAGTFGLKDGIFYNFCQKAINDPDREYVFIIDEINRGNLSQIFGELLMLIEHDKRGKEFSVPLVYSTGSDEANFYVPSNLYLIGLMNMADRSLAMVDYALRRRFAFINLPPQYESETFRQWLIKRSMAPELVQLVIERMTALNRTIREDPLLGENYQIGHSFFCPKGDNFAGLRQNWYQSIVRTEIVPLLKEYWFDDAKKVGEAERRLLSE
jgi:5-methylcytosine-specific restriction protein B